MHMLAQIKDKTQSINNKNLLLLTWKPPLHKNSKKFIMGNFIIKIIVINIIIKINSQKTKFSSVKVVAKINKTLKINSGETLNLGRN